MIKSLISNGITVGVISLLQVFVLFAIQVSFARILEPADFGIFAFVSLIVMFITHFGNVNGDKYIIKHQDRIDKALNTVFTFELLWSLILVLFSIFILPLILTFIDKEHLTQYIQLFSLIIFYQPFAKPRALFEKDLSFIKANIPMLISNLIGGIVGVLMAYNNYGIWGLIVWKLSASLIETIFIWFLSPIKPKLEIDYSLLKDSLSFGYPLLVSGVLVFMSGNVDYYLVDLLLTEQALGLYWMAYQISHYLFFIRTGINKVLYPTLTKINNFKDQIKLFDLVSSITSLIYFLPVLIILFFGQEIIVFVYGEKWLPSSILLQILSVVVLVKAVSSNVGPLLHTYSYTKVDMEVAVINLLLMIPLTFLLTYYYDTIGAAIAVFIVGNISVFYTYNFYVKKLINRGYLFYFKKIIFLIFVSLICLLIINYFFENELLYKLLALSFLLFLLFINYKKDIEIILDQYNRNIPSNEKDDVGKTLKNKKYNFLIFSGAQNLNRLGATKSTDKKLVQNLIKLGYQVTWVGRGKQNLSLCQYHNIGNSNFTELIVRIYNKIKRDIFGESISKQLYNEFIHYDKKNEALIKNGIIKVDKQTIIIGRSGMSYSSFKAVNELGGKSILHSQWMHPNAHNKFLSDEYKKMGISKQPILKERIERQLLEIDIVDKVWSISSLVSDSYISNKIEKNKLIDCGLGVDLEKYQPRDSIQKNSDFNILFVGNVNFEKGCHILLKACLQIKSSRKINIIFNGAIAKNFKSIFEIFEEKLNKNGIKVVHGYAGSPVKNYQKSSVFILPSIHESFGLVVLEAMASGLPVILSDNVGAKDCIKEDLNGFTFPAGNDSQLAKLIQKLIDNPSYVKKMSLNSREISKLYDWKIIVKNLLKIINENGF